MTPNPSKPTDVPPSDAADALHSAGTRPPVQAAAGITIDASARAVWDLLLDVQRWPHWNAAVTRVDPHAPLAIGATFSWRSQGVGIRSTITELRAPSRLAWSGRALGTRAVHVWELQETASGCLVRTSESFDGWLPRLMRQAMQRKLEAALTSWLSALKAAAEAPRRGGAAGSR